MEKTFDVFADIVNKDSMVKTYNERRQKACMNMVCQIEFLEQKLAKMKKDLLKCKDIQPCDYVPDMEGTVKYIRGQADDLTALASEIDKCEAVMGALR